MAFRGLAVRAFGALVLVLAVLGVGGSVYAWALVVVLVIAAAR